MTEQETFTREEVLLILKRVYRRMQAKAIRLTKIVRKNRNNPTTLMRAFTWENACLLIEEEINALGGKVNYHTSRKQRKWA